jgi:hypothetical protein
VFVILVPLQILFIVLQGPDAGSVQAGGKLDDVLEERQTGSEAAHDGVWKWWQLGGLFACAAALALFSVLKVRMTHHVKEYVVLM